MRLDLLVPTFRRPLLLKGTLESIARAERPRHLEVRVVIVDNDEARGLPGIEPVMDALPYPAELLHEPAPGKSNALNTAVTRSAADYVGLIDDDEELDTRWFRVVEDALEARDVEFIGGRSVPKWEGPQPAWIPPDYPAVLGITDMGSEPRPYGPDAPGMLCGGNAVIARETLLRIGLFCPALGPQANRRLFSCEDEDLYLRLLDAGARGRYVPDLVIHHRIHPERLTKRYHRAWAFWNGASKAVLNQWRPTSLPTIAGVPRYLYGEAARGLLRLLRLALTPDAARQRFSAELSVWHLAGHLYGRYFPERASGGRISSAVSAGIRRSPAES